MLLDRPPVEGATVSDGQPDREAPQDIPELPPQQLPALPPPLQFHIPIKAGELEDMSKLELLHELKIQGIFL